VLLVIRIPKVGETFIHAQFIFMKLLKTYRP